MRKFFGPSFASALALVVEWACLISAPCAFAGVPRTVFIEQFGATWCSYCPFARCALEHLEAELGPRILHLETHVSPQDPFTTPESQARADRYGVSSIPHVMFDGLHAEVGATACAERIDIYQNVIDARWLDTDGLSPIDITGGMSIDGDVVTVTARFRQVDSGSFTAHQATLYLWEDLVPWCCGGEGDQVWNAVVRMVRSTPVALHLPGQVETVTESWDVGDAVGAACDPSRLHAAAVFEEVAGAREMVQASDFHTVGLSLARRVASVANGFGDATYNGTISNWSNGADTLDLSVGGFPWPAELAVDGVADQGAEVSVVLDAQESRAFELRVHTDGLAAIRDGILETRARQSGDVARVAPRLFNRSPAILLLDLDSASLEYPFLDAFEAQGFLYDEADAVPVEAASLLGYDIVVAHTGYMTAALGPARNDLLHAYLQDGGNLLLSSMDFLTGRSAADPFVSGDLGVSSWTNSTRATIAIGVPGDPVTNGMSMPLTFPSPSGNRVDTVVPGNGASTIFVNEHGHSNAVRYERANGARTILSTIVQTAFPGGHGENSSGQFLGRSLDWLLRRPTAATEGEGTEQARAELHARPQPFARSVRIELSGSAARTAATLDIFDASGRLVRTLSRGPMGSGQVEWDGHDQSGRAVSGGLYFARWLAGGAVVETKLVRVP